MLIPVVFILLSIASLIMATWGRKMVLSCVIVVDKHGAAIIEEELPKIIAIFSVISTGLISLSIGLLLPQIQLFFQGAWMMMVVIMTVTVYIGSKERLRRDIRRARERE